MDEESDAQLLGTDFIVNLDTFLTDIYTYYKHKGFLSYLLNSLFYYLSIVFTAFINIFFSFCFDWEELNKCRMHENSSCKKFVSYIRLSSLIAWSWFIFIVLILPLFVRFVMKCRLALINYKLYLKINVNSMDMRTMNWVSIIRKLHKLQTETHFVKCNMKINAINICSRIMRIDNYKIAVYSHNILPLGSPSIMENSDMWFMGQVLEKNIDLIFFKYHLINYNTFELYGEQPENLTRRFKLVAILNFFLTPIIILYVVVYFIFDYSMEMYSKKKYTGQITFTPHALWVLREYNELPHQFNYRLTQCIKQSETYLKLFTNPVYYIIVRGLIFTLSGLILSIGLIGLLDDSVLLKVNVFDRSLVWYFAVMIGSMNVLKLLVVDSQEDSVNPNIQMRKIASFTHIFPDSWRKNSETYAVKEEFEKMIPNRLILLLREIICIISTPYILWYVLPEHSSKLINFCKKSSQFSPELGYMCKFSTLSLKKYGDSEWKNLMNIENYSENISEYSEFRLVSSKLEKSYIMFKTSYPRDIAGVNDEQGDTMISEIKKLYTSDRNFMIMTKSVVFFPENEVKEEYLGGANEEFFWSMEKYKDNLSLINS